MTNGHQVETRNTAYFRHDYGSDQSDLRRLYEQAKIDQWNAAKDIDWSVPLEGDGGLISDDLVDINGTRFWNAMSEADRIELNRRVTRWRLSTLVQGEHGAMLLCSQLVECVQGQDAKLFQSTQVADEARHNEVLQRYIDLRLDGEIYPVGGNVREIFDTLLGTSSWYLKTIGLQLVAETFAVSLFRMLAESSKDAVLRQVCRRILQDEARHMGFAMLSLPDLVAQATDAEHREMEDFAVWRSAARSPAPSRSRSTRNWASARASSTRSSSSAASAPRAATRPRSASTSAATCMTGWSATCARSA